ncbi:MAG: prephenate dehydratase domain-containing protein [Gemmatimonadota bacterium]
MNVPVSVGFQGEPGAFSEEAVGMLVPAAEPVPHASFDDVVQAVERGAIAAGDPILPHHPQHRGGACRAAPEDGVHRGDGEPSG